MINKAIFYYDGPTTGDPKFGPEPSLKEIITLYYERSGIERIRAQRYTREYIEAWLSMHGTEKP